MNLWLCVLATDILSQPSIHGYVIGATNALFKAKSSLWEVLVDIEEDRLEVQSPEVGNSPYIHRIFGSSSIQPDYVVLLNADTGAAMLIIL